MGELCEAWGDVPFRLFAYIRVGKYCFDSKELRTLMSSSIRAVGRPCILMAVLHDFPAAADVARVVPAPLLVTGQRTP